MSSTCVRWVCRPCPSFLCRVQGVSGELQETQREASHLRQAVQDKEIELEVCWVEGGGVVTGGGRGCGHGWRERVWSRVEGGGVVNGGGMGYGQG